MPTALYDGDSFLLVPSKDPTTANVRTAGIICFAIGVIMFLVQEFTGWGLYHVALLFAPQNELIFMAPLLTWTGAILVIMAGAVMFFAGKRKEDSSSLSGKPQGPK